LTRNPSVTAAVVRLLKNITDAIRQTPVRDDESRKHLDNLTNAISGSDTALADAVVANTMVGSVKVTPVEEEEVAEKGPVVKADPAYPKRLVPEDPNPIPGSGTVGFGASTTSIPTSTWSPNGIVSVVGRTLKFDDSTSTIELRGQAVKVTGCGAGVTPVFFVASLPVAPTSGDTFSVF